ncbi:hypothetical protein ABTL28_19565, partial [Acinetobacter baumannii]
EPPPAAEPPPAVSPRRRWAVRLLVGGVAALLLTALGFDAWDLVDRAFTASLALGTAAALVLAAAALGAIALLLDEWR